MAVAASTSLPAICPSSSVPTARIRSHGKGGCGAIEKLLLSITPLPPITTVLNPPAVLSLPPLTVAYWPLAVLSPPPLTLGKKPLAVLVNPPLTLAATPLALFSNPPLTLAVFTPPLLTLAKFRTPPLTLANRPLAALLNPALTLAPKLLIVFLSPATKPPKAARVNLLPPPITKLCDPPRSPELSGKGPPEVCMIVGRPKVESPVKGKFGSSS